MKLHGYNYQVEYKKGAERGEATLQAISRITVEWINQFKEEMATSTYYQKKLTKWDKGELDGNKYSVMDGLLYYKIRLVVDPKSQFALAMSRNIMIP